MADLLPTAEQQELATSVARLLASEPGPMAALAELGWLAIGMEIALVEQALVVREFGRVLAPLQTLGAITGARIATLAGEQVLASDIASGAKRVALLAPTSSDEAYLIDDEGAALALLVDPQAALLFATADLEDRSGLASFDSGLSVSRATRARPMCRIESAQPHREILVLAAAYCTGLCEAICAMAGDYAKIREQFGQPIGSFQAVKHRCADMAIHADAAWAQTVFAALSADRGDGDFQALSAFIVAACYAIDGAQENIQLHGAIGTTEELMAHRYLKRAHVMDIAFGSIGQRKEALLACPDLEGLGV